LKKIPLIAIIDDDAPLRYAIENLLRSSGLEPRSYLSAERFLADAAHSEVDLIISDFKMPGITGLELQATLNQRQTRIPMILISAVFDDEIIAGAMTSGVKLCLQKPFDDSILMSAIAAAL
jgi:FixJ family two-component response regulator